MGVGAHKVTACFFTLVCVIYSLRLRGTFFLLFHVLSGEAAAREQQMKSIVFAVSEWRKSKT